MRIRDLIDELIVMETEHTPDTEVSVDLSDADGNRLDNVSGCFIEGTGHNEDGSPVIMAVAP